MEGEGEEARGREGCGPSGEEGEEGAVGSSPGLGLTLDRCRRRCRRRSGRRGGVFSSWFSKRDIRKMLQKSPSICRYRRNSLFASYGYCILLLVYKWHLINVYLFASASAAASFSSSLLLFSFFSAMSFCRLSMMAAAERSLSKELSLLFEEEEEEEERP